MDVSANMSSVGGGSGTITALNNQTESRLVTIGSTTTELDGEANMTFDGSTFTVTGDAVVTDDLTLNSDSAVLNMGDGNDFTITHDGTTGATLAGNPITITSAGAATWSTSAGALTVDCAAAALTLDGHTGVTVQSSNSGDITLDSVADIVLDAAGGNFEFKDAGTTQLTIDVDGTAGDIDINLNVDGDDLVFNQYDGTEVIRFTDTARVGINDADPQYTLDLSTTGLPAARLEQISNNNVGAILRLENSRGGNNGVAGDYCGAVGFFAQDAAGNSTAYGTIRGIVIDPTNGSEDGKLVFEAMVTGSTITPMIISGSVVNVTEKLSVGTTSPAASAILDLTSTTKGFLPPRLTTTQRDAVGSPAEGLFVYNDTTNALNFYNGSAWTAVGTGGGSVTAINNATANELVTIGSTTTELDAEANLTFDGSTLTVTGHILPGANGTKDLGSADYRWRNIYTGDLHLKNERGDWTIVEEEDYLTIVNNKKGKKYKFVLEEIE
jgi:hypothetical protein